MLGEKLMKFLKVICLTVKLSLFDFELFLNLARNNLRKSVRAGDSNRIKAREIAALQKQKN